MFCAIVVLGAAPAMAQVDDDGERTSGIEVAVHGGNTALRGRPFGVRGRAFRVQGLSTLAAYSGASVRGRVVAVVRGDEGTERRIEGAWGQTRANANGDFDVSFELPTDAPASATFEIEVGGEDGRTFDFPLSIQWSEHVEIRTDRRFYQSGETVHVWALVRDARSGAPIANRPVTFARVEEIAARTNDAGVASIDIELGASPAIGSHSVSVTVGGTLGHVRANANYQIGVRTTERLMATLEWDERQVAPGEPFAPRVTATDPSGAPVRDASVSLTVQGRDALQARTNRDGVAVFSARAPAFLVNESGLVSVSAVVTHSAHGQARASRNLLLAVPLALHVEASARTGSAMLEVPSDVYITVLDAAGDPPPVGTEVVVRGAGIARPTTLRTDSHGIVSVTLRLRSGEVAELPACTGTATMLDVEVLGTRARRGRVCVPVDPHALVMPLADAPVASPGDRVRVRVERRAAARREVVALTMWVGRQPMATEYLAPNTREASFEVPATGGLLRFEAMPIFDARTAEVFAGSPHSDALLVRPRVPSFVEITPEQDFYPVEGEAILRVKTEPGQGGWLALDVRDITQHGGEVPFAMHFLSSAFSRAMLDPATEDAETFLRAALGAHIDAADPVDLVGPLLGPFGRRNDPPDDHHAGYQLRDPVREARILERWGVADIYRSIEGALKDAQDPTEITRGNGTGRRFTESLPFELNEARSLGEVPMTVSMLTRADPSFTFENVARRIARVRLLKALMALAQALGSDEEEPTPLAAQPSSRWVSQLIRSGALSAELIRDPWGGSIGLRTRPNDVPPLAPGAPDKTLAYPGPDGRLGTADDIVDPFARVVPTGTPYAVASGEDDWMRAVARLAPGVQALQAMLAAYERITADMQDALIASALLAGATEGYGDGEGTIGLGNIGTIGHGGGGGSGSGYGRGSGGLRGRSARTPSIRTGHANVSGAPSLMSGLIREDMPATLFFLPSRAVDPSGTTLISVPLAQAATTYIVEVIHWRPDGWVWSDHTRVRVDQELVVDGPVPRYAMVGDELHLSLRANNRGTQPRTVQLSVHPEGDLGMSVVAAEPVVVPPGDSVSRSVVLEATQVGAGKLVVQGTSGDLEDGTRRSLDVLPAARRSTASTEAMVTGTGRTTLAVPAHAVPRGGGRVVVTSGRRLFPARGAYDGWVQRVRGETPSDEQLRVALETIDNGYNQPVQLAAAMTVAGDRISPAALRRSVIRLTSEIGSAEASQPVEQAATLFMFLSPLRASAEENSPLARLLTSLERVFLEGATARSDDPSIQVAAAAAFVFAGDNERAEEHARRARRSLIQFGDEAWVQARSFTTGSQNIQSSALMALVELKLGHREAGFRLLQTLTKRTALSLRTGARPEGLNSLASAFAHAAASLVSREATQARVTVDGEVVVVSLEGGRGEAAIESLDRPGDHVLEIAGDTPEVLHVFAESEFAIPWDVPGAERPPLRIEFADREPGVLHVDGTTTHTLVVRNLRPRTMSRASVEVQLPTGVELDEQAMNILTHRLRARPVRERNTLMLNLRPLLPGRTVRLAIRVRWTLAGRFSGFGIAARSDDRPDLETVLAPERFSVGAGQ